MIEQVWNQRSVDRLDEYLARDVFCHTAGHRVLVRRDGYARNLLTLLAALPDGRFLVHDIAANHSPAHGGIRVAVVWQLHGTYRGVPHYGPATHSPVHVLGCSQFLFRNGKITHEWRVYDDIAIRAQIAHARGDLQW